ncbi:hypothetical protein [Agrobacterium pusense]|uniref:hypothetical protein n=1 Tax=Agrobacterium pusense TaxID=648995 RepID=UPI000D1A117A|nr:hypothetical protein [Agrobacterium pusense]
METYPDIVRRAGTLFFACADNDRAAISTSIERLIDLLDAMDGDPDLEPYLADTSGPRGGSADDREGEDADFEPILGAAERHPHPSGFSWGDEKTRHSQEQWATGNLTDAEDDGDDLEPDNYDEPTFGWQNEGNQESLAGGLMMSVDECEPNGDELDYNGDELDYSPIEDGGYGGVEYDGSGVVVADKMIRGMPQAAARAKAYQALGVFPLVYDFRGIAR